MRKPNLPRVVLAVLCSVSLTAVLDASAADANPPNERARIVLPNFSTLVKRYGATVVNISVTREVKQVGVQLPPGMTPDNPLAPFVGRRVIGNREEVNLGSGFIVSADGYVLTNRHVVGDASVVDVKLTDKREFKGRVIGSDALSDIALVKIDAQNLPAAVTGDPAQVEVGDWVMAIGSPYGFANTVTAGIVSARSRSLPGETGVPFIQTDVPINPGNSGGPLFDLNGHVIAINSLIYSKTGGYQGLSFAVPIDVALDVKDQLLRTGRVSRGRLGVAAQDLSQSLARSFGLTRADGALISMVEPGGPAASAGLRAGDIVQAIDEVPVNDSGDLLGRVAKLRPGTRVDLRVWRAGGAVLLAATVGALPGDGGATPAEAALPTEWGLALRPLTAQEQQQSQVDHGLLIQRVAGRAARIGLHAGDIVLSVNDAPVATVAEFATQVGENRRSIALLIQRGATRLYVPVDAG
ncbi:Do family serine endopeptidase [Paraburkholderia sp.]|uniref:Do family serine endopeptidase n=1 Tax=Paraburkholderia sp. TaxID=1926495 RepID=UPI003D6FAC86